MTSNTQYDSFVCPKNNTQQCNKNCCLKNIHEYDTLIETGLDLIPNSIIFIRSDHTIIFVNNATQKMFQYEFCDLIGKNISDLMPHVQKIIDYCKKNVIQDQSDNKKAQKITFEHSGIKSDSTNFPLQITATLVHEHEEIIIVLIIEDITERVFQEESRKTMIQSIEKLNNDVKSIMDEFTIAMFVINEHNDIILANKAAYTLFELAIDNNENTELEQIFTDSKNIINQIILLSKGNKISKQRFERFTLVLKNNIKRIVDIEVINDPRNINGLIIMMTDVSDIFELQNKLVEKSTIGNIIGNSALMQQVFAQITDYAMVDLTVLILGDTGTGKELVARAIHDKSNRSSHPFIAINCASLTENIANSQLFGHKKGSFTGAIHDSIGYFESAENGTLFLDEIGELPLQMQAVLLRVIQEREISRLGEIANRKINIRIIAATNRNLLDCVQKGTFRSDLYYRINVATISLPPLRKRKDDIPMLVHSFVNNFRHVSGTSVKGVDPDCMSHLLAFDWPGNIRQLQNSIESAIIRCKSSLLRTVDLPDEIILFKQQYDIEKTSKSLTLHTPIQKDSDKFSIESKISQKEIVDALHNARGNKTQAAKSLGIGRTTLYRYLQHLKLNC